MKTNIEIEALEDEMQRELNKIEEELEIYSDYAMAYGDLRVFIKRKIKSLTSFVSQYKEAK